MIKNHAETKAALISAMNLANFLIEQKQFAAALEVVEAPRYTPSEGDLLSGFCACTEAGLLENKKAEEAIKEYNKVIEAKKLQSFHAEAWLKAGIAHELKGIRQRLEKRICTLRASSKARSPPIPQTSICDCSTLTRNRDEHLKLILTAFALLSTGCSSLKHSPNKFVVEKRWCDPP